MRYWAGILGWLFALGPLPKTDICTMSGTAWPNQPFATQLDTFTVTYDDTPNADSIDGQVGMSQGVAVKYADWAVITRLNASGRIDVRDSTVYRAAAVMTYRMGLTYHFRVAVDTKAKRYSVWVTPYGGIETQIADRYRFRAEQSADTSLAYWTLRSSDNIKTHTVCNWTIGNYAPPPPPPPPPPPAPPPPPPIVPTFVTIVPVSLTIGARDDAQRAYAIVATPNGQITNSTNLQWLSSDTTVARVVGGVVIPIREGEAVITARDSASQASASISVAILPPVSLMAANARVLNLPLGRRDIRFGWNLPIYTGGYDLEVRDNADSLVGRAFCSLRQP